MASSTKNPKVTAKTIATFEDFTSTPGLYKIDARTVIKTGVATGMAEAAALRFVRENTSVPVPQVYDAYMREDDPECGAIVMEFIKGDTLNNVWAELDQSQKDSIKAQLKDYVGQLRAIKSDFIGAVDGGPCHDQIFSDDIGAYGPFKSDDEFREGCIQAMYACRRTHWSETVAQFIRALPQGEIVLTHNDLHPRNIIVRDGQVVGIVDWEMSGFYPKYWEYVKAWYRVGIDEVWVQERAVDDVLEPYPLALAVFEHTRDIVW
ncbi:kinase-like domain-containing protein [Phyllosticta capitalensis]